jgi:hypothetical protein
MMVLKLSLNAQKTLDDYINQVKAYLKGIKSVDAEEIVQNINEHIENELTDAVEPMGSETLNEILLKLGSPQQWVPEEELSWWKKFVLRLRTGPEDWRLAYLSFGLFIIGFLLPPAFLLLVPASYLVSRAAMSLSNHNIQVKAQKWLIYPSLIVVNIFIFLMLLLWPLIISINIGYGLEHSVRQSFYQFQDDLHYWIMACSLISSSLGLWWLILATILMRKKNILKMFCWPFTDTITRKLLFLLWLAGLVMMIIFTAFGLWYWL